MQGGGHGVELPLCGQETRTHEAEFSRLGCLCAAECACVHVSLGSLFFVPFSSSFLMCVSLSLLHTHSYIYFFRWFMTFPYFLFLLWTFIVCESVSMSGCLGVFLCTEIHKSGILLALLQSHPDEMAKQRVNASSQSA